MRNAAVYIGQKTKWNNDKMLHYVYRFGEFLDGLKLKFKSMNEDKGMTWKAYLAKLQASCVGSASLQKYMSTYRLCKEYPRLLRSGQSYSDPCNQVRNIRRAIELSGHIEYFRQP